MKWDVFPTCASVSSLSVGGAFSGVGALYKESGGWALGSPHALTEERLASSS